MLEACKTMQEASRITMQLIQSINQFCAMLLLHEVYCVGLLKTSSVTCVNQSENTLGISNQSLETNQDQLWLTILNQQEKIWRLYHANLKPEIGTKAIFFPVLTI